MELVLEMGQHKLVYLMQMPAAQAWLNEYIPIKGGKADLSGLVDISL